MVLVSRLIPRSLLFSSIAISGVHAPPQSLKTPTSLKKESRPYFLGDNRFGVSVALGGPEGYFCLAIIAFGATEVMVPKY